MMAKVYKTIWSVHLDLYILNLDTHLCCEVVFILTGQGNFEAFDRVLGPLIRAPEHLREPSFSDLI